MLPVAAGAGMKAIHERAIIAARVLLLPHATIHSYASYVTLLPFYDAVYAVYAITSLHCRDAATPYFAATLDGSARMLTPRYAYA